MTDNGFGKLSMQVVSGRPKERHSGRDVDHNRREWPVWTAAQMRAADEYLQEAGAAMTESGAARRQQRVSAGP